MEHTLRILIIGLNFKKEVWFGRLEFQKGPHKRKATVILPYTTLGKGRYSKDWGEGGGIISGSRRIYNPLDIISLFIFE